MKYLVLGAAGFVGSHLLDALRREHYDVVGADVDISSDARLRYVDLHVSASIDALLAFVQPSIIIQTAGLVEQSERALSWNPLFTRNLLDAIVRHGGQGIDKIVIIGSAAEYGEISLDNYCVNEETPLRATDFYGRGKALETICALSFKEKYGLPIIIARPFNILGVSGTEAERPGSLIANTLKQIGELKIGLRATIDHLNRFDTARDYIDIEDVVGAVIVLATSTQNRWDAYNIGSGYATTNKEIVDALIKYVGISDPVSIIEKSQTPERRCAECADISRLTDEFGWKPTKTWKESLQTLCRREHAGPLIPILIVGAGTAGQLIARDVIRHIETSFRVVGFVDDSPAKKSTTFEGIPVLGTIDDLPLLIECHHIGELLVAIPSERGTTIQRILNHCEGRGVKFKILPRQAEVVGQEYHKDYYRYIRELRIEDILGGSVTTADTKTIRAHTQGKTILITGAAGSIGSELSRQLAASSAKTLIFYDWWENGMFELRTYLTRAYPAMPCHFIIGDIRDKRRFQEILKTYHPNTIFHAAAYKHVGLMEENPTEAIKNNILGTKMIAESAIQEGVEHMVFISSDKAVDPKSIMGTTKRISEKLLTMFGKQQEKTRFSLVRFGNVMHSHGSVIPLFQHQIEAGGPVTVSDERATRYFMTIPEAVHLVLQAWVMGRTNDLYILDMGDPVSIKDLARFLIILRGYTVDTIGIRYTGLKPGEKVTEALLAPDEKTLPTDHERILRIEHMRSFDQMIFSEKLEQLIDCAQDSGRTKEDLHRLLGMLVND